MPTEEQTVHNTDASIFNSGAPNMGQKLTIPNRTITKISFYIKKEGTPTGAVTFIIYLASNDDILASKVLSDASALQGTLTWEEVTLDVPTLIDAEVRMCILHPGWTGANYIKSRMQTSDVKGGSAERWTRGALGAWNEAQDWDFVYIYTYEEAAVGFPKLKGVPGKGISYKVGVYRG